MEPRAPSRLGTGTDHTEMAQDSRGSEVTDSGHRRVKSSVLVLGIESRLRLVEVQIYKVLLWWILRYPTGDDTFVGTGWRFRTLNYLYFESTLRSRLGLGTVNLDFKTNFTLRQTMAVSPRQICVTQGTSVFESYTEGYKIRSEETWLGKVFISNS